MITRIVKCLVFILLLASCANKKYKYVEVVKAERPDREPKIEDEDAKTISAASDSAAYLEAFTRFCVSRKVSEDTRNGDNYGYITTPLRFKLYNDKGIDIVSSVHFADKDKLEKRIEGRWFLYSDSIAGIKKERSGSFGKTSAVDSAKIKTLSKFFRITEDEFSNDNKKWYKPRSAPIYTNANGIYCYFQTENGIPGNLRFRVQYYSDDWLFFSRVQFSIDGKAYEYIPSDTETDSGNGGYIWEWFDEPVSGSDKELINAMVNAKSAKMKLIGRQYHNIKIISKEQIGAFKNTIELYQALGGRW